MSLLNRLSQLEKLIRPGKMVVIRPDDDPDAVATIDRPSSRLTLMRVPCPATGNPLDHVTPEQRKSIGPNDTIILVRYVERSIPRPGE